MLYIFDDDQHNAIAKVYNCDFLHKKDQQSSFRYYRSENEIDITVEMIQPNDIVCFHNSFPCDKTFFMQLAQNKNEEFKNFTFICFSGDSSFYNLFTEEGFVKIHKDRFYHNLKSYIDSSYDLNKLLYGDYGQKNEIVIICNRINSILFAYQKEEKLPINEIQPRDLKRICELSSINYTELVDIIKDHTVQKFKSLLNILIQNK